MTYTQKKLADKVPAWEGEVDSIIRKYYGYRDIINNEEEVVQASIQEIRSLISSLLLRTRQEVVDELVEKLRAEMNRIHACEHSPATMSINADGTKYSCCTDIHIGRREALSDVIEFIRNEE